MGYYESSSDGDSPDGTWKYAITTGTFSGEITFKQGNRVLGTQTVSHGQNNARAYLTVDLLDLPLSGSPYTVTATITGDNYETTVKTAQFTVAKAKLTASVGT